MTPPTPGRVRVILVRDGDRVANGQPIARLDDDTAAADARLAEASLHAARMALRQASAPTRPAELRRVRAEAEQAAAVARARQSAAEQRLADLERGPSPEQIAAAEAAVEAAASRARASAASADQAKSRTAQAQRDHERISELAQGGAVSQADADRAASARDDAAAGLRAAEETNQAALQAAREADARLRELQAGTRQDVIGQARADVRAARAAAEGAMRAGSAQVRLAEEGPRREDVAVARARVEEASKALAAARARLSLTVVTAPAAGVVTRVLAFPGAAVGAATPVARLVPSQPLEVLVDVDENHLGRLRTGLDAIITSDAYPEARATARVGLVGAQVDADRGSVQVRVYPSAKADWLRSGQTVSVNIIVARERMMRTVPLTAVVSKGDRSQVFVVERGLVTSREVRTGPPGAERTPVISGLADGTAVIVDASSVRVGQKVRASAPDRGRSR